MDYKVQLNNGQTIDLKNAEFDATAFTTTLNDREISFVNIGGAVISKHTIIIIFPVPSAVETQS